jgi:hypothetical protein
MISRAQAPTTAEPGLSQSTLVGHAPHRPPHFDDHRPHGSDNLLSSLLGTVATLAFQARVLLLIVRVHRDTEHGFAWAQHSFN